MDYIHNPWKYTLLYLFFAGLYSHGGTLGSGYIQLSPDRERIHIPPKRESRKLIDSKRGLLRKGDMTVSSTRKDMIYSNLGVSFEMIGS